MTSVPGLRFTGALLALLLVLACAAPRREDPHGADVAPRPIPAPVRGLGDGDASVSAAKESSEVPNLVPATPQVCVFPPTTEIPSCAAVASSQVVLPLLGANFVGATDTKLVVGGSVRSRSAPRDPERSEAALLTVTFDGKVSPLEYSRRKDLRSSYIGFADGYRLLTGVYSGLVLEGPTGEEVAQLDADGGFEAEMHMEADGAGVLVSYYRGNARAVRVDRVNHVVAGVPGVDNDLADRRDLRFAPRRSDTFFEVVTHGMRRDNVNFCAPCSELRLVQRLASTGPLSLGGNMNRAVELGGAAAEGSRWVVLGQYATSEEAVCPIFDIPPRERESSLGERASWGRKCPQKPGTSLRLWTGGAAAPPQELARVELTGWAIPGRTAVVDGGAAIFSYCAQEGDYCYLARVTLDGSNASVCVTDTDRPVRLSRTASGFAWVEHRYPGKVRLFMSNATDLGMDAARRSER